VMLDVDDFKKVNDEHGHPAGDQALRQFARVVTRTLRSVDVFCRFGGDEFALILPGVDRQSAALAIERLRWTIGGMLFPVHGRTGEVTLRLTFSAGIADYPTCGVYGEALVEAADVALYAAKAAGKDRVELSETAR
jgi:diguanylate cyclase (GGDEF)-like protein